MFAILGELTHFLARSSQYVSCAESVWSLA
jgi:hypothetical protein